MHKVPDGHHYESITMRLQFCCLLLLVSACIRGPIDLPLGPVENDYFELIGPSRATSGEPLPTELIVKPNEAYYITFTLRNKPGRPEQLGPRPVATAQDCPCLLAVSPPGTRPKIRPGPSDPKGKSIIFSATSRLAFPLHTRQHPLAPDGHWIKYVPEAEHSFRDFIPVPADGSSPYYTVIGAPQTAPGVFYLELYTYPTIQYLPAKTDLGEPFLLWRCRLTVSE